MLLDLKKVFLNEGEKTDIAYTLDLSKITIDGIAPMPHPVKITAVADNRAGVVKLSVAVCFTYVRPCDRCFADTAREMSYSFAHILVASLSGDSSDDYVEAPDFQLDLDELVTADVLLELPSKYLCKDSCKGLCPNCGADLNRTSCDCSKHNTDPRLEVLKELIN